MTESGSKYWTFINYLQKYIIPQLLIKNVFKNKIILNIVL